MGAENRKILVYAQHLSGVGHYVRTYEIARALSRQHSVHWVEGGRPVPHRQCPDLTTVALPRICRDPRGELVGVDSDQALAVIQQERASRLIEAVERIRPDAFLVEYFPFSKWELAAELVHTIQRARTQGCRIICSLRDVVRQTRFETCTEALYRQQVLRWLHELFDVLLVHADPSLIQLEDSFGDVAAIKLPLLYTGIVSEPRVRSSETEAQIARLTAGRPFVLVSAGGSDGGADLVARTLEAWRDPEVRRGRLLVICSGLNAPKGTRLSGEGIVVGEHVIRLPFQHEFLPWLAAAELSISQCGYNTAANLLETRSKAIVWPHPRMSDQELRAQRLFERGLVQLTGNGSAAVLGASIAAADRSPTMQHSLRIDGAEQTAQLLDNLLAPCARSQAAS